jgi:hypothetical protein
VCVGACVCLCVRACVCVYVRVRMCVCVRVMGSKEDCQTNGYTVVL